MHEAFLGLAPQHNAYLLRTQGTEEKNAHVSLVLYFLLAEVCWCHLAVELLEAQKGWRPCQGHQLEGGWPASQVQGASYLTRVVNIAAITYGFRHKGQFMKIPLSKRVNDDVRRLLSWVTLKMRKLPEGGLCWLESVGRAGPGFWTSRQHSLFVPSAHPPPTRAQPPTGLHVMRFL